MKRILVLDDDPARHEGFRLRFRDEEVHHAYRYVDCIHALRTKGPWDLVCLDHDLADHDEKTADYFRSHPGIRASVWAVSDAPRALLDLLPASTGRTHVALTPPDEPTRWCCGSCGHVFTFAAVDSIRLPNGWVLEGGR